MQAENTVLALEIPKIIDYQCGMSVLKDLRVAKNLTQAGLADLAGTSQPQIRRLENGDRQMTKEWAERLAPHLGVLPSSLLFPDFKDAVVTDAVLTRVIKSSEEQIGKALNINGEVAAGLWMEADIFDSERVEKSNLIGGDKRYPSEDQYLLRIRGESLNRIARDGDLILCVDYANAGIELKSGDLVVVERSRDGGHTLERTAKRIFLDDGMVELRPESNDPRFQEPIVFNEHSEEASEVRVIAKVLGAYRQF